jgi:hypothetical protein
MGNANRRLGSDLEVRRLRGRRGFRGGEFVGHQEPGAVFAWCNSDRSFPAGSSVARIEPKWFGLSLTRAAGDGPIIVPRRKRP